MTLTDVATPPTPAQDPPRRWGGTWRLLGPQAAQRVWGAHVAVVGVGGVGSWAAEALARMGVGALTLIDLDHVAESNLNRQIHATDATLGLAKVVAMAARIASFHPDCKVHTVDDFVGPTNWPAVLPDGVDAVIDACDQLSAKAAMAVWALAQRRTLISVGAAGGKRQAQAVAVADLADVTHDPLLAKLRYTLRRHHGAARQGRIGLRCVYSTEAVAPPHAACGVAGDGSLNCAGYGSLVSVTATFGMVAAGLVIDTLAQVGASSG